MDRKPNTKSVNTPLQHVHGDMLENSGSTLLLATVSHLVYVHHEVVSLIAETNPSYRMGRRLSSLWILSESGWTRPPSGTSARPGIRFLGRWYPIRWPG